MARGGHAITLAGLAGMGDLVLTCTGELSRNRTVGLELGKGRKLAEILAGLGHVAEGVKTAKSAFDLVARRWGSTCRSCARSIASSTRTSRRSSAVRDLMTRELGPEFDSMAMRAAGRRGK